ncbi:MAG: hypothetical protein AB7D39_13785 [Pseudodesulfovibrio sp.]|uniref:hypothetical protein n=1 Tax=Pseudodesulfovibrio sp. TaxID=2035812 RepID=UPI003D13E989
MSKIIPFSLAMFIGFAVYSVPFNWFKAKTQMHKHELYELCGYPMSVAINESKEEYWESGIHILKWKMKINHEMDIVSHVQIYLHVGLLPYDIKIYGMRLKLIPIDHRGVPDVYSDPR